MIHPGAVGRFPPGATFGERWIRIGDHTLLGPYVSLSAGMVPGQKMVTDPVVRIGDRCMIGRGSHIVGHFNIDIGDDVYTGPYIYVTDQNHGYEDPDEPVYSQMAHRPAGADRVGQLARNRGGDPPGDHPRTQRGGRGGFGGAANLPGSLRDRRGSGPDRPSLRARVRMGHRADALT